MVGDIERVLRALNEAEVRYLIVGGVAVVLHGYLRTTADLDLVIQLDEGNVRKALQALAVLGYHPRAPVPLLSFADEAVRKAWIRDKNMRVFSLWSDRSPALEVDLFVSEPFDFAQAHRRAVWVDLETASAPVVSREDLILLKRQADRPRDREDLEALEALDEDRPEPGRP